MTWHTLTEEDAWMWASRMWLVLVAVWVLMWLGRKKTKKREAWGQRMEHGVLVIAGFYLLSASRLDWAWLNERVLPAVPGVWLAGLAVTALGIAAAIWARLSLGSNWSGMVTLKADHELVRSGLYRWIRHPIYTGILAGMIGSAMIRGYVRGWIGVVLVLLAFYLKARREESFLREEFGAGFDEHRRQTGMFLPKLT
ncbi:MAG TPA: isoprenylcysteine carboxylmethyltransferase family protein [Verrucomicrobiae bacterium]|nr:isoprenylcysteine carboxylmethyltransferase family protein [Verrucomicrobiae bacterium]